jgi:DNA-binding MarR family transcriptional regulator
VTTKDSTAELSASLRSSLMRLVRMLRHQRADMSITVTQLSALNTLKMQGPMSAGELAASERVQPPSMTKVIAGLEDRGLLRREAHPSDRRQAILMITESGKELLDSESRLRDEWLSARLEQLSPDERALLADVLRVFDKLAQQ